MESRGVRALAFAIIVPLVGIGAATAPQETLPAAISDQEFWGLVTRFSETPGTFPSGNPLSDELFVSSLAAVLASRARPGGAYLGVGREQNFTYIAATRPRVAFITDIHRRNLHLQLMYKALFELSANRADFVSRLFTKPRPTGLTTDSTALQLIDAYWHISTSAADVYQANLQQIKDVLVKTHGLPLSADDLGGIEEVYYAFYWHGPQISHTVGLRYADLMFAVDYDGNERSFLANEALFAFVKDMQSRNLIVPVVADLAGPKALRAVGDYLRDRQSVVTAFYVSGTPETLSRTGRMPAFCANVASMPFDGNSIIVRPDIRGLGITSATTERLSMDSLAATAHALTLLNQSTAAWSAAAVVPIAEDLKRCQ